MTGNTIAPRALKDAPDVALQARDLAVGPGKRISGLGMVKSGLLPAPWGMALLTERAKLAVMLIILAVTGKTINRCTCQAPLRMAAGTLGLPVPADEGKYGQVMVDGGSFPAFGRVALITHPAQTTLMNVVLSVTAHTIDRIPLKGIIWVAFLAVNPLVSAHEGKSGQVVIDLDLLPARRRVASIAQLAQASLVGIILSVAAQAVGWCP